MATIQKTFYDIPDNALQLAMATLRATANSIRRSTKGTSMSGAADDYEAAALTLYRLYRKDNL